MLVSSIALALALQASPTVAPQRAFAACLHKAILAGLDDKVEPDRFAETAKGACLPEEAAYRAAMIEADRKSRISAADAAEAAADEIAYWRDKATEDYAMYFKDGTRPLG
jgi:hypothetical protein